MPIAHVGDIDLRLTEGPPVLVDPITITLTNTPTGRVANMLPNRDYIIRCPEPITVAGGVEFIGGRSWHAIGGAVHFDQDYGTANGNRGLYIKGNASDPGPKTGYIEGWELSGILREGLNIDTLGESRTRIVYQNIITEEITGSVGSNHADIIQTWRGPYELHVDRLYGKTSYQGFFFNPLEFAGPTELGTWKLKRVYLEGTPVAGALLYLPTGADGRPPVVTENVWLKGAVKQSWTPGTVFPTPSVWGDGVRSAPGGKRSPVTCRPGVHYVSPGYIS